MDYEAALEEAVIQAEEAATNLQRALRRLQAVIRLRREGPHRV